MAASFPVSPLARALAPLNPPPRCPLPHSLFAPPSHPSSRHAVSPLVSFSCRPASSSRSHFIPSCPMCRTAFRPSCGRAVLFSSSHRSPHALPSSSPHDRITRAGQRIPPHAPGADKHGANEQHAHRNDTDSTPPPQERLITYPQGDKTNEKKTRRASKTPRTRRYDETEGRRRPRETQMRRTKRTSKTRRLNETEGRDAPRDEQEQQESNERRPDRKNETPHGTPRRDERRDDIWGTSDP